MAVGGKVRESGCLWHMLALEKAAEAVIILTSKGMLAVDGVSLRRHGMRVSEDGQGQGLDGALL